MKLASAILALCITAGASLPALAAMPASPNAAVSEAVVVVPVRAAPHRFPHAAPRLGRNAHGSDGFGPNDWSHWSRSYHPGWPCVSGDSSMTSAYPTWEVRPYCR
jgi:hypothetical protein